MQELYAARSLFGKKQRAWPSGLFRCGPGEVTGQADFEARDAGGRYWEPWYELGSGPTRDKPGMSFEELLPTVQVYKED